jgi:hypothetical protein
LGQQFIKMYELLTNFLYKLLRADVFDLFKVRILHPVLKPAEFQHHPFFAGQGIGFHDIVQVVPDFIQGIPDGSGELFIEKYLIRSV